MPPGTAGLSASSWYRAINDRIQQRLTDFGWELDSYQVQVLLVSQDPSTSDIRPQAIELFLRSRERIVETLIDIDGRSKNPLAQDEDGE